MDRLGKVRKRAGGPVDVSAAKSNVPIGASTKRRRVLKALQSATPEDSAKRSLNARKPDAIAERRATHPASPKTSPINASPVETPRSKRRLSKAERSAAKCHPIPKIVLPEHFVLLERVFEALQTVALLRASCRGQRSSFDKCRADVERYTRRRFEMKHLQQLKYLLPDVVHLEYAKAGGIDKRNNDTELVFRIEAGTSCPAGGNGSGSSLKDRLRRALTALVVEHYKQYLIAQGQPQPQEAEVWKGDWDPVFSPGSTPEVPLAELPPQPAPCTPSSSCQRWNSSNASTPASRRTPIRTPGSGAAVRSRLSFGEAAGSAAQGSSAVRPREPPHTPPSQVLQPHGAGAEVTSKRRTWLCSAAAAAARAGSATPPAASSSASVPESRPATPAASSPASQPAGLAALQLFTPRALQRMAENTARRERYHSAEAQAKQSAGVAAAQLPCMLDRLLSYFHHKGASALPYDDVVGMLCSQSSRGVIYSAEEVAVQLRLLRSAAPEALALEPAGGQHPAKVRILVQAATAAPVRARLLKMVATQQALD